MKSLQYLREIRQSAGLPRAVLRKITVEGRKALFLLVTDTNYTADDVNYARRVTAAYAEGLAADVKIVKSVPSEHEVKLAIGEFLREKYPALSAFIREGDIEVMLREQGGNFRIRAGDAAKTDDCDGIADAVSAALGRMYCGVWPGDLVFEKRESEQIARELPPEERLLAPRFFDIIHYSPIDGGAPVRAMYIADLTKEFRGVTVCGAISHIEERETKNGKPYFSVTIGDGTGTLRAAYFSRKATLDKVRELRAGMWVCLTGDNEFFNGGLSFRIKSLDLGCAPEGFIPEERPARPYPAQYKTVFPVPAADLVQANLFDTRIPPEDLKNGNFVVFDLETTGLSLGGTMDHIIEIGAVKIEKGSITERFSTFVACPIRLPAEIVKLTGITDEMLVGAPELDLVLPDFYKFTEGCALVAHNTQFDCRVLRYYGDPEGYIFGGKQYDTLFLAQELLHLKNYKLNTIAEYFGFDFNHHRAYEDAFVTAKIFIELIHMRGSLPA